MLVRFFHYDQCANKLPEVYIYLDWLKPLNTEEDPLLKDYLKKVRFGRENLKLLQNKKLTEKEF